MENILDSPTNEERNVQYAGFWIRVAAYIIDAIILGIINALFSYLILGHYTYGEVSLVPMLISFAVNILYFPAMECSSKQATLGKMAVGIKVGDLDGEQIAFGTALGRYFAKIISAIILCIGFMMVGWDDHKQGLHDKLANTYVYYA